jgi:hypothetical protein
LDRGSLQVGTKKRTARDRGTERGCTTTLLPERGSTFQALSRTERVTSKPEKIGGSSLEIPLVEEKDAEDDAGVDAQEETYAQREHWKHSLCDPPIRWIRLFRR